MHAKWTHSTDNQENSSKGDILKKCHRSNDKILSPRLLLSLQRSIGNSVVARIASQLREPVKTRDFEGIVDSASQSTPSAPLQRIITVDNIKASPEMIEEIAKTKNLSVGQQKRLDELAKADIAEFTLDEALEDTRNTVVAAVDGLNVKREARFLGSASRIRDHLSAYDPEMKASILKSTLPKYGGMIPSGALTLTKGSVKDFGKHVPYTDILIPHPGPWIAKASPPDDLASCLEYVLGVRSSAYVVTDHEPDSAYSEMLKKSIDQLNQEHVGHVDYLLMQATITPISVEQLTGYDKQKKRGKFNLAGAELTLGGRKGHRGQWHLVTITRGEASN